jgi:MoaA/NifB/PqqE/SkfB family radical SAM enzyme
LKCRYCGQRLTEFDKNDVKDFELADIKRDIDNFMDAADYVGMISIIGGEPFIHPQLAEIVRHCLTKENFGVVNITTNGIVSLTEELLRELKDDRVKIYFSVYDTYLTDKQKKLLEKNIELVKKSGISYALGHPVWVKPNELKDYGYEDSVMADKKQNCWRIRTCAVVRDGVFYPCTIADNIESLRKFSAGNAVVDVKEKDKLRERLQTCLEQDYFEACRYCCEKEEEIPAGEQI